MKRQYSSLKSRKEIHALFANGKARKYRNLAVRFKKNDKQIIRVVWAVPRKSANAVTRNRLKRQAKAALDAALAQRPSFSTMGRDIAFVIFPEYQKLSFIEKRNQFSDILLRLQEMP